MKWLSFFMVVTLFSVAHQVFSQSETRGNIEVRVKGIQTEQGGNLLVLLYRDEDSWLEVDKAFKTISEPALKDNMIVVFENLDFSDVYAIQVIHDKNKNNELDMRTLPYPKPKEGSGVSNNTYRMGPPLYEKARVNLNQKNIGVEIELVY